MTRLLHGLAALAILVLLSAAVVDRSFEAQAQAPQPASSGDDLFFDLEVRDAAGDLIARPRVMGKAGRTLRVDYADGEEPGMCIILDPLASADGLDMSIDLSVDGRVKHHRSRIRMPIGERQSIDVPTTDGGRLEISLLAYRMDSPAFEIYLEQLRSRVGRTRRAPEA